MVTTLTLPALAFLMAVSGIPGLNALPGLRGIFHHKSHAAVVDTIPPQWTPASRLALRPHWLHEGLPAFGREPGRIRLDAGNDPRKLVTNVDPDSGFFRSAVTVGSVELGSPFRRPLPMFGSTSMQEMFAEKWRETSREKVSTGIGGTATSQRPGLSLAIPVQLPKVVTSLLGPGGPALNVSGSENIRLSGTSDWTNQQTGLLGAKKSLFPSLDMQQDLNIQLEGQLSDRVKVNLLQNSATQVPLANRIAINYHGEEDDLIQELDLGNTSLSLPGTQYVSYSGRNEGLFGVKVATRIGALDFTALASKQEGKSERASYSGGASLASHTLADLDYDKGRYFLLYDPSNSDTLLRIDDASIKIYRDDANYGNDINTKPAFAYVDPDGYTHVPMNGVQATSYFRGSFDLLNPIDDYEILPDYYVLPNGLKLKIIRLKQPVSGEMCLAASFTGTRVDWNGRDLAGPVTVGGRVKSGGANTDTLILKMLRAPRSLLKPAEVSNSYSRFDSTAAFDPVRELEMKNFYQLPGFHIDPKGFKLSIQKGTDQPPVVYARLPNGTSVNYLEILGLDNFDESQATRIPGHDEKVDGTAYQSGARLFIDYDNGTLWFPDLRPFAPRITGEGARFFDRVMDANLNRRIRLTGTADSLGEANDFYDLYNPLPSQASRYYIVTEFAAQQGGGDITLGRGNILPGSDVVTVNGERWQRDKDYTIDYDLGHVTLRRSLGATDQLNVDYSYAPLFAQASKTLIGSAFRLEGRERSLGGAFLYESQGAQDLRPRLGEEPSRTLITDLNAEWRFKQDFLTHFVDRLPGVRTTAPSDMTVQAELGASFPNPNTKNEVYIDDMEGVRDAVSLSLSPERWTPMSVPSVLDSTNHVVALIDSLNGRWLVSHADQQWDAELHWYMPPNVFKEKDLKPTLTDGQGAKNPHQVLALAVPRFPRTRPGITSAWAGLTYQLDDKGIDLSRSQFIDLWVNDYRNFARRANMKLHIDLGVVSEDQMRTPDFKREPYNTGPDAVRWADGVLQSEDLVPRDHQLTVTEGRNEDTGYDGLDDAAERALYQKGQVGLADLVTATPDDPDGDDWGEPVDGLHDIDPRRWYRTNGSENNKKIFPYPNTEDLNLNDNLDTDERYYEYTIDLSQTHASGPYLVTDVYEDYANVSADNGWRRFRIPIADKLRATFNSPDLTIARHVRLWFEGLQRPDTIVTASTEEQRPQLVIGGFDIVGSRWLAADLTTYQRDTTFTTMTLNSVSSIDNADIYIAPFDPGQSLNGNQVAQRQERTLSLEFTNLARKNSLEAYRTFSIDEDYTRYNVIAWYAAGYDVTWRDSLTHSAGAYDLSRDSLYYYVRFASDERGDSYYEVRRRVPANSSALNIHWEQVRIPLADLSNLKLARNFPQTGAVLFDTTLVEGGERTYVTIKGRPSFTRLRRVSFGLVNLDSTKIFSAGQLWFDEIRSTDVQKDVGIADRLLLSGHVANLASYNVSWNSRDANFLSVGESRGSGSKTTNLAVTSQFEPHRFFEGTGIQVPVSFVYNENTSRPRFSAGDDVRRTGAQQDASMTRGISRSVSTSYARNWGANSNPLLRYTVGGLTANAGRTQNDNLSPTGFTRAISTIASVNWGVSPRALLPVRVPLSKLHVYPLPERLYWTYNTSTTSALTQTRSPIDPTVLQTSSTTSGRTAGLTYGMDSRPIDLVSHHIDAVRSLSLAGPQSSYKLGGLELGRTTAWHQTMNAHWGLQAGPWLQPNLSWNSNFGSIADLQSYNLAVHQVTNGQSLQMNWTLPFDRLLQAGNARAKAEPPVAAKAAADSTDTTRTVRVSHLRPVRHFTFGWRDVASRVGNLQTDATIGRSSAYSRLTGQPTLLYTLGLTDDPGLGGGGNVQRTTLDPASSRQKGIDWRANARTRVPLVFGSAVSARFSIGDRTSEMNGVATRSRDARFPDLDVEYGKLANMVGLTRLIQQPGLRTSWVHSLSSDYRGTTDNRVGRSTSDDFHPLLSFRGAMRNGAQADLSVNKRNTVREVTQFGTSTTYDDNTDINFTLSRNYSAGQKISVLGKTKTVRSSGSLQLATVYSHHTGRTIVANSRSATRPIDDTRMSVTGTGNYGFSSAVTGSAVLGFSQSRDNTLDIIHRSIRVELRAQFTF